ncbi:MAG: hypothetical protein AMXMBFR44_1030 [Candidatus Campbellbacteria bacterium]
MSQSQSLSQEARVRRGHTFVLDTGPGGQRDGRSCAVCDGAYEDHPPVFSERPFLRGDGTYVPHSLRPRNS